MGNISRWEGGTKSGATIVWNINGRLGKMCEEQLRSDRMGREWGKVSMGCNFFAAPEN